jgi:flagellar protein FliO/FliZ
MRCIAALLDPGRGAIPLAPGKPPLWVQTLKRRVMQTADYLSFVVALALVLALILALGWAVRRFGLGGPLVRGMPSGSGRRLAVVEVLTLDARRKMVLVKRDEQEHLLLLGAGDDLVIERVAAKGVEP